MHIEYRVPHECIFGYIYISHTYFNFINTQDLWSPVAHSVLMLANIRMFSVEPSTAHKVLALTINRTLYMVDIECTGVDQCQVF